MITGDNEIFYAIIFYSISALFSVGVNIVFFLRARRSKLLTAFLNVQIMVIIWLLAKVMKKAAPTDELAWLWVAIQYISVCTFGAVFLDFAYLYQKGKPIEARMRRIMYAFSGINYFVAFTNPMHHLFFTSVTVFESEMGPWFYVHTSFSYALIVLSYIYLIRALLKNDYEVPLMQAVLFNVGLLLPILSNVVYISKVVKFAFDITPIMFNMTIIVFGYSAYRYRFLDIKKITRNMVLENIHEGIIIVDANNRVIKANANIRNTIKNYREIALEETFEEFMLRIENPIVDDDRLFKEIMDTIERRQERWTSELAMMVHGVMHTYILKLEIIKDHSDDFVGYVLRLIDVTKHKELLQNVEEKNDALIRVNQQLSENISANKQLAVTKERNRVSKEIHDILGHSMTVVISLLDISKRSLQDDVSFAHEKVIQGMEIIRSGLIELKKSLKSHSKDMIEANVLNEDLSKLIDDFEQAGIVVDYYYKKSNVKLSSAVYDTIYRICQEGLTNALRHGEAKNVTVGLRYVERHIDLFIIDDGKGCENIVKGNGLKGMENRVRELTGYFSCGSPDGDGFNIHVTLPFSQ